VILFIRSKGGVNDGNLELAMQNNGRVAKLRDEVLRAAVLRNTAGFLAGAAAISIDVPQQTRFIL
jgi:hypothetical protein